MKKKILELSLASYKDLINSQSESLADLNLLYMFFSEVADWIIYDERKGKVYLWIEFLEEEYSSWNEMPKLEISKSNYDYIETVWKANENNLAPFLVFIQDDSGWITLERKQELSADDLKFIEEENERCLKDYK